MRRLPAALLAASASLMLAPQAVHASETDVIAQWLSERSAAEEAASSGGLAASMRDRAAELVVAAMNYLGVRYVRGGNGFEEGFDCSGFTRHVFANSLGLALPRRAEEQAHASSLAMIQRDELKPGDLVFFNTLRRTFSHVGIYIGEGRFIHAPRSGAEVRIEDMRTRYWSQRFDGARRAENVAASALTGSRPATEAAGWLPAAPSPGARAPAARPAGAGAAVRSGPSTPSPDLFIGS